MSYQLTKFPLQLFKKFPVGFKKRFRDISYSSSGGRVESVIALKKLPNQVQIEATF